MANDPLEGEIDPLYVATMQGVLEAVDEAFNGDKKAPHKPVGVVLLVFPFGDHESPRCNFISNGADRGDLVAMFKDLIQRFERQHPPPASTQ